MAVVRVQLVDADGKVALVGIPVMLNTTIAVSNFDGIVEFRNVPLGTYKMSIKLLAGPVAFKPETRTIVVSEEVEYDLGMIELKRARPV